VPYFTLIGPSRVTPLMCAMPRHLQGQRLILLHRHPGVEAGQVIEGWVGGYMRVGGYCMTQRVFEMVSKRF